MLRFYTSKHSRLVQIWDTKTSTSIVNDKFNNDVSNWDRVIMMHSGNKYHFYGKDSSKSPKFSNLTND